MRRLSWRPRHDRPLFRHSKSFAACSASDRRFGVAQHEPRPVVIRDNNSQPHLAEKEMGSPRLSRGRPHNSVRIRHTLRHRNGGRRD
jgi:hypothetical protein